MLANAFDIMDDLSSELDQTVVKLPRLAWNGNISDTDPSLPGFFWVEQSDVDEPPAGWTARRVKIGSGIIETWASNVIDVNLLNWRSRWICTDSKNVETYYAQGAQIPSGVGTQRSHIQVILDVYGEGSNEPIRMVWGSKGVSKTLPFNNTYIGKNSKYASWPSVTHRLHDWASQAGAEIGRKVYPQLAFRVNLGTHSGPDGQPLPVQVGRDFVTTRYIYSVQQPSETKWRDVYIGDERYGQLAQWMKDEGRDWLNDESFFSGNSPEDYGNSSSGSAGPSDTPW